MLQGWPRIILDPWWIHGGLMDCWWSHAWNFYFGADVNQPFGRVVLVSNLGNILTRATRLWSKSKVATTFFVGDAVSAELIYFDFGFQRISGCSKTWKLSGAPTAVWSYPWSCTQSRVIYSSNSSLRKHELMYFVRNLPFFLSVSI